MRGSWVSCSNGKDSQMAAPQCSMQISLFFHNCQVVSKFLSQPALGVWPPTAVLIVFALQLK